MSEHKPRISVVIPTIGRPELRECARSLKRQTLPPCDVVIVKDEERRGASWARNRGIERSSGDIIAFIDDDCVPGPEWLEKLAGAMARHDAAGAGGGYDQDDPLLADIDARRKRGHEEQADTEGLVGIGGNVAYRRDWLERLIAKDGYAFNESFRHAAEDYELPWRLRQMGARLVYVPCNVRHLRRISGTGYVRLKFKRGIGVSQLYRAHKISDTPLAAQKSLAWPQGNQAGRTRWLRAFWKIGVGPFDRKGFSSFRNYLAFWTGEKAFGLGFLWGLARHRDITSKNQGKQS